MGPFDVQILRLVFIVADKVPNIVKSFGVEWKRAIESINQEVMQSFTNFKNGTTILQVRNGSYLIERLQCLSQEGVGEL